MPKRKNLDAPVWEHFTRYEESGNCVCNYCPKSYKLTTAANSHSSLWYHVKNKHPNKMISSGNASESEQESTPKKKPTRQVPITAAFLKKKAQEEWYAELICLDRFSFNKAASSELVKAFMQLIISLSLSIFPIISHFLPCYLFPSLYRK